MRKAAGTAGLVVKNILFTGFTVQICLGLFWMAGNLAEIQDFAPVDTGVYPFFVHLAGKGYPLIYLLQLGFALYAGYRLSVNLHSGGGRICLWGGLALMTLPMAMQCHMALLPYSLVCSLALLEISLVCELWGKGRECCVKKLAGILACYGAQCLLWPKYCIPGAVLPLLLLLLKLPGMLRKREQLFRGLLLAVCFLAAAALGYGLGQKGEDGEGGVSGWNWMLVKRVCWPTLWVDMEKMTEEIQSAVRDVAWVSGYYPHNMELYFKPALEAAMSPEAADLALEEMVRRSWDVHGSMVIRQIGWDVLGYGVTPLILPLQLAGEAYDSYSGRNYEIMRDGAPVLTKYYVRVACGWFGVSLLLTLGAVVLSCIGGPVRIRKALSGAAPFLAVLFAAGFVILFFTVQGAGIMDYKYTVWINQLWIMWSIKAVSGKGTAE